MRHNLFWGFLFPLRFVWNLWQNSLCNAIRISWNSNPLWHVWILWSVCIFDILHGNLTDFMPQQIYITHYQNVYYKRDCSAMKHLYHLYTREISQKIAIVYAHTLSHSVILMASMIAMGIVNKEDNCVLISITFIFRMFYTTCSDCKSTKSLLQEVLSADQRTIVFHLSIFEHIYTHLHQTHTHTFTLFLVSL